MAVSKSERKLIGQAWAGKRHNSISFLLRGAIASAMLRIYALLKAGFIFCHFLSWHFRAKCILYFYRRQWKTLDVVFPFLLIISRNYKYIIYIMEFNFFLSNPHN